MGVRTVEKQMTFIFYFYTFLSSKLLFFFFFLKTLSTYDFYGTHKESPPQSSEPSLGRRVSLCLSILALLPQNRGRGSTEPAEGITLNVDH